ncbi:MAG: Asp23/Gls24 family envelope stress response protein [Clostridia bacterium]|nr:Asp23/Gls24 family envelope stress response protein [Clostridia bacterium]
MQERKSELSVSTEVIEKMAELAVSEIDGVVGVVKRSVDLKNAIKSGSAFKGVKVESINGAVAINVYVRVAENVKVRAVAEAIQANVKDKIQTMTGTAVTKVNVIVADVEFEAEKQTEETAEEE